MIPILKKNLLSFENLSEELQERVAAAFENDVIDVFQGGKYNDEIRTVYYELLSKNVSVNNVESVIRTVLSKLAGTTCSKLPKKSLTAELFAEMNLLLKVQVREAILSSNNVLHCDGTKYNFNEVGSFQVTTSSGSYTLGIEDIFSGEAQLYFGEIKSLLYSMSKLVVPENYESDVQKLFFSFKSLRWWYPVRRPFFFIFVKIGFLSFSSSFYVESRGIFFFQKKVRICPKMCKIN